MENNEQQRRGAGGIGTVRRQASTPRSSSRRASWRRASNCRSSFTPAIEGVDLAAWVRDNRDEIERSTDAHGAILFRGFGLSTTRGLRGGRLGDLPRPLRGVRRPSTGVGHRAGLRRYAVPARQDDPVPQRELAPADVADEAVLLLRHSGGRGRRPPRSTTAASCSRCWTRMSREQFEEKGLMYVRNFSEGVDVPWQEFFHTDDRAEVERICAEGGMTCEWTDNALRVKNVTKGVATHPRTGEKVFFNQVQLHHVACLEPETRDSLRALFAEEDMPRNVYLRRRHADSGRGDRSTSARCSRRLASSFRGRRATLSRSTTCSSPMRGARTRSRGRCSSRWAR